MRTHYGERSTATSAYVGRSTSCNAEPKFLYRDNFMNLTYNNFRAPGPVPVSCFSQQLQATQQGTKSRN
eukprot:10653062-Prorocentrum_lima.AAC.1